ncbi:helix-turn-helix transcriptional regulator [Candidatus Symbiobacter mobilis]|uniref:Transcriptional regulator n=1 Tax=Candidatus Symbiobacter mobilis CR TaxID=946483 RepID=U5N880_9BURK|nr:helix-turn-helix transcriptional regulator [Candidatus Symbiobacter mobilis]AGX87515.1 transcriptional regulator [Candidatus Symbiobacter mobilis CR]
MTSIDSAQTLGTALRAARKRLGLTQADLALAAGVGLRFIVDLEGGKNTVRLEQVLRVIDALGGSLTLMLTLPLSLTGLDAGAKPHAEIDHGA